MIFLLLISLLWLTGCDANHDVHNSISIDTEKLCQFEISPCIAKVDDIQVSLDLLPKHAPSEQPISVTLGLPDGATKVNMRLEGRDMFMGMIPVKLAQNVDTLNLERIDASRMFYGTLIYGRCASGYMVWRAIVSFEYQGKARQVWFDFLADTNPYRSLLTQRE